MAKRAATTPALEREIGRSRRTSWPAPKLSDPSVFDAIDLGFGPQGLALALFFGGGFTESNARKPTRFRPVLP